MLDIFPGDLRNADNAVEKSNLSLRNLVCGHIVTIGNGIEEIGISFSVKRTTTGYSFHVNQIL